MRKTTRDMLPLISDSINRIHNSIQDINHAVQETRNSCRALRNEVYSDSLNAIFSAVEESSRGILAQTERYQEVACCLAKIEEAISSDLYVLENMNMISELIEENE